MADYRQLAGALTNSDTIQATPRNPVLGGVADLLGMAYKLPEMPRIGVPGIDFLAANRKKVMDLLGMGDVQKTADALSYGNAIGTGKGMTYRPKDETIGAALTVAPMVAPAARMVGKGAMETGRFVAPKAGQLAEQYMVNTGGILPLDVYHGTPHTLPPTPRNPLGEFDASKIGTGEGAQAYGHGIYTAENPAVAKSYQFMEQNWFDTSKAKYKGKSIDSWYEQAQKDQERAFRTKNNALEKDATARLAYWENVMTHTHPESVLQQFADPAYGWPEATNYAKSIDLGKFSGIPRSGNLYKVDLPDEKIAKMLDWDKPLSQQPANVQSWLKDTFNPYKSKLTAKDVGGNEPTGSLIYNRLQELMSEGKKSDAFANQANFGASNASKEMVDFGIPGVQYLDEGSRPAGKGTRNFVVFPGEEKNMTILERNGQKK